MQSRTVSARRLIAVVIIFLLALSVCAAGPRPKNIILMIGDGMGIGPITATRCAGPGENGQLVLDTMPVTGLVKTHPQRLLVTDSAAAGTALATGHKTDNGRISVDSSGRNLPTILERAAAMGKSTGVITTDSLAGATPAAFYAHADSRGKLEEIAGQLLNSNVTVAMGSGRQSFSAKSAGKGEQTSVEGMLAIARQKGFDVVLDSKAMSASDSDRLLGLFSFDESGPTLAAMMDRTISVISQNKKGFFMMAESYLPDSGGHRNIAATSVKGVADLDDALRVALKFAEKDRKTLVVVTSDHDTGGLAVMDRDEKNPQFKPGWVSVGHTGNMVAVYAFGPGAERFAGTHDNTEIPRIFADLWGQSLESPGLH